MVRRVESMPVRRMLLDDQTLACEARTTLAAADEAVLVLGSGRWEASGSYRVQVRDDDGEPVLLARRDAAVDRAAAQGRLAGLLVAPRAPEGVGLRLYGRLTGASVPAELVRAGGERMAASALRVERVVVTCPHPGQAATASGRELPIDVYGTAEPDDVAAALPRLVAHLNVHHGADLRRGACRYAGRGAGGIAAAQIAELGKHGMRLGWIDDDGGHDVPIAFESPARSLTDLTARLRRHLC